MKRTIITALLLGFAVYGGSTKRTTVDVTCCGGVFAQIADGNGWQTTVTLVNMEDGDAPYRLSFFGEDGTPMKLNIIGVGLVDELSGTLNYRCSRTFQTSGANASLSVGWAALADEYTHVGGQAIFAARNAGRPDFEAVVPMGDRSEHTSVLPYDNTKGFITTMAIVNPSTYAKTTVTAAMYDDNGVRIGLDQIELNPGQHLAFALQDRWSQVAARRGTIEFTGTGYNPVLGLRFNPSGAFTSIQTMWSAQRP